MNSDQRETRTSREDASYLREDEYLAPATSRFTIHHVGLAAILVAGVIGLIACARAANSATSAAHYAGDTTIELAVFGTLVILVARFEVTLLAVIAAFVLVYLGFALGKRAFVLTAYAVLALWLLIAMLGAAQVGHAGYAH